VFGGTHIPSFFSIDLLHSSLIMFEEGTYKLHLLFMLTPPIQRRRMNSALAFTLQLNTVFIASEE
jgi:hypothetical protein